MELLCYNINDRYDSKPYIIIQLLFIIMFNYFFPLQTICIILSVIVYDYIFRLKFNKLHPVSLNTVSICGGIIGWFIMTLIKNISKEFLKLSIVIGWSIVTIQIYFYSDPLKKYKSVPNNVLFLLGSVITTMISSYNTLIFEKNYNTQIIKKVEKCKNKDINNPNLQNIENNTIVNQKLYKCNYGDIILLNFDEPTPLNVELFTNSNNYIKVDMCYVTGEKKLVEKMCNNIRNIDCYNNKFYEFSECKNSVNLLPRGSIIKKTNKTIYGRIIKVAPDIKNNNTNYFNKFIENIKHNFIIISLIITFILLFISYYFEIINDDITVLIVQSTISAQMIIPLSYNTVINIIFSIIYKLRFFKSIKNIPISAYENLIKYTDGYLVTDKTGTLTENIINIIDFHMIDINIRAYNNILPFLADQNEEEEEEIAMCTYLINHYDYTYNCNSEYIKNNTKKNIKLINGIEYHTICLGLLRSIGGTITLVRRENESYLLYQGVPNEYFIELIGLNISWCNSFEYRKQLDINNNNPHRDWFHLKSEIFILSDTFCDNFLLLDRNSNEYENKLIKILQNILITFKPISIFFMENPLKPGVSKGLSTFNNMYNSIICTGDNEKNTLKVCQSLNFTYSNVIYVNSNENYIDFVNKHSKYNNLFIFKGSEFIHCIETILNTNNYIVFSSCTPIDKELIVTFIQNMKYHVTFTGDGINDTYALKKADLGICFPKDNSFNYLPIVKQSADVTSSDFSESFWEDWGNDIFVKDINNLSWITICLLFIMVLKCCKSGIQLGNLLLYRNMSDPLPNPFYDSLFDLILLVHWIFIPIKFVKQDKQIHLNEKQIKFYPIIYCIISYIIGSIISYIFYYYLDKYYGMISTLTILCSTQLYIFYKLVGL